MFGALTFDRDPLTSADVAPGVLTWFQVVGGFAFLGLLLWLAVGLPRMRPEERSRIPAWQSTFFVIAACLALACYLLSGAAVLLATASTSSSRTANLAVRSYDILLTAAGALSILAAGLPFLLSQVRFRWGRIFALAKLSFKEALRRRVLYAFAGLLVVLLFASWFLFDTKPEDEVRTYVSIVFEAMTWPLLLAGVLVAAFSIPADIKNQTIHTIVTKPVERFEVVLGRFLGFLALMTLVLIFLTAVSLLYVLRGVHPEAAAESLKAREPLYGTLHFENTEAADKGISVGREWDYRSYITKASPGQEPQTARWDFAQVPASLAKRPEGVRFEYTFDIYRTTKGEKEGADIACTVRLYSWRYRRGNDEAFRKARGSAPDAQLLDKLAEEYGYYEIPGLPVTDYHTQAFTVPAGLFRNIAGSDPELRDQLRRRGETPPDLQVRVTCDSVTQYIGMARYDLYMRLDDPQSSEKLLFAGNFFAAAFGLWLKLALVMGLAVILSTYLSGVITLLVVATLYFGGVNLDFIESVALGKNAGGGPAESMLRMFRRELVGPRMEDSSSTTDRLVGASDDAFRWTIRRLLKVIPDIGRFDMTSYVAEGFAISWGQMGMALLLLAGYLIPWLMLSFYLIRWREIANPQ